MQSKVANNAHSSSVKKVPALEIQNTAMAPIEARLAIEAPLHIAIDGLAYTVTMRTPGNDHSLVRGLLFTEGIAADPNSKIKIDTIDPNHIDVRISNGVDREKIRQNARAIPATSSCGVCGRQDLDADALDPAAPRLHPAAPLDPALLPAMMEQLTERQVIFHATGGTHAVAIFTIQGDFLAFAEDIGRHNAVDKVVGSLVHDGKLDQADCLCISGRASYEIVTKAFRAALPFVIAISAPSSLAVELAAEWGITLIGFCRGARATLYSNPSAIQTQAR